MTEDTIATRAPETNVVLTAVSNMAIFDGDRIRRIYCWLVDCFEAHGIPITHAGYAGARNYEPFRRARKRLEAGDWSKWSHVTLMHFKPERKGLTMGFQWTAEANVGLQDPTIRDFPKEWMTGRWRARFSIDVGDVGLTDAVATRELLHFLKLTVDEYVYLFVMMRRDSPSSYASGSDIGPNHLTAEQGRNRQGWGTDYVHFRWRLLRDVYPCNCLSRSYLDLDVCGQTLEEWISEDPARGALERVSDRLTLWRPPVANIPILRENLFRAGLIFHYKDFPWTPNPDDVPGPRKYNQSDAIPDM